MKGKYLNILSTAPSTLEKQITDRSLTRAVGLVAQQDTGFVEASDFAFAGPTFGFFELSLLGITNGVLRKTMGLQLVQTKHVLGHYTYALMPCEAPHA